MVLEVCFCSVGDHVVLNDGDLCHVGTPQFVSVCTLAVCGQRSDKSPPVYLTQQLSSHVQSTHMQSSHVSVFTNFSCAISSVIICSSVKLGICMYCGRCHFEFF